MRLGMKMDIDDWRRRGSERDTENRCQESETLGHVRMLHDRSWVRNERDFSARRQWQEQGRNLSI
jgi:hypothetical protein